MSSNIELTAHRVTGITVEKKSGNSSRHNIHWLQIILYTKEGQEIEITAFAADDDVNNLQLKHI